ncbi:glucose 1-dehydrogenase [Reichenbachiella ulvae]|uniref:Glucose 1-dehydrogenase n=1 Tax=Reichenbachiella ulvae TaxID=2980104 RepID=A0ABT3CXS8_9BACT|nr:glucose 1-dehydrogenase [Reichenbachiella ulvae]MCV9388290.1 glucose 1-dehydrogenase [Reichenbachiella ulvae]
MKLENKVAVITGGNSGIGLATAKLFVQEGAKVVITGRRQEALDEAVKEIGGGSIAVLANAKDIDANKAAIEKAVATFGKIDILFLNAGIAHFMPMSDITEEHFNETFDTNVKGPFFTIKHAIPHLNEGAVILSNTSVVHHKGFAGSGIYSATKAALRSVTRVLANELKEKKIRTVSLAPGPVETPIYGKMDMTEDQLNGMAAGFAAQVPLGRFGASEELAKAALFLVSDDASFITGEELIVDGGIGQV